MYQVRVEDSLLTPTKIICVGRNYVEHINELGNEVPAKPVIFCKPNSAITDTLTVFDESVRYEAEIVFVVANEGFMGVGVGLDLTKVIEQEYLKSKGLPWERAKAFDRSAVLSPFAAYQGDGSNLEMNLFVNGALRQHANYELMIYKPLQLLGEVKGFMSFEVGDLLMSGTPKGVGSYNRGDRFFIELKSDESVILEHEWIAT